MRNLPCLGFMMAILNRVTGQFRPPNSVPRNSDNSDPQFRSFLIQALITQNPGQLRPLYNSDPSNSEPHNPDPPNPEPSNSDLPNFRPHPIKTLITQNPKVKPSQFRPLSIQTPIGS